MLCRESRKNRQGSKVENKGFGILSLKFFAILEMSDWQQVLDKETKEYYYWNTKTNETTWDKPKELQESKKVSSKEPTSFAVPEGMDVNSKEYYDWYMENMSQAAEKEATNSFASFQKKDEYSDLNYLDADANIRPAKYTRAFNQMGMYFDVSQYSKEMAAQKMKPASKTKLTKKQVEKFKKKKIERQKQSLIFRLGPDE